MARDARLAKRNAFVLTGGLLVFWCLVALVYAQWYRVPPAGCLQGEVLLGGCRAAGMLLVPPAVLGAALVAIGLAKYRGVPETIEGHLHHGTGVHFTIAWFASIVAVGGLSFIYVVIKGGNLDDGEHLAITIAGTQYLLAFVLKVLILLGAVGLAVALGMHLAQGRLRRSFLEAADAAGEHGAADDGYRLDRDAFDAVSMEGAPPLAAGWTGDAGPVLAATAIAGRSDPPEEVVAQPATQSDRPREEPGRWHGAFGEEGASPPPATTPHMALEEE